MVDGEETSLKLCGSCSVTLIGFPGHLSPLMTTELTYVILLKGTLIGDSSSIIRQHPIMTRNIEVAKNTLGHPGQL